MLLKRHSFERHEFQAAGFEDTASEDRKVEIDVRFKSVLFIYSLLYYFVSNKFSNNKSG